MNFVLRRALSSSVATFLLLPLQPSVVDKVERATKIKKVLMSFVTLFLVVSGCPGFSTSMPHFLSWLALLFFFLLYERDSFFSDARSLAEEDFSRFELLQLGRLRAASVYSFARLTHSATLFLVGEIALGVSGGRLMKSEAWLQSHSHYPMHLKGDEASPTSPRYKSRRRRG